jgi:hypothetical protein
MASMLDALICAVAATLLWTCLGLPIARRLAPGPIALPIAPALGWAVHSAAALPVFFLIGFSQATVLGLTGLCLAAAIVALLLLRKPNHGEADIGVPMWALAAAALLAFAPAAAILPKIAGDSVALAAPIFDHAKVAMIDEMSRLGVPPGNPFFGETGEPTRLAYYYLWHFSAAELALLIGMSGWAADAGLTWFTAFASLTTMMGFAAWLSGRTSAALWILPISFTASLRPVLGLFFKVETLDSLIFPATGLGGWLFQSAWVPQHVASASCVVIAVFLISQLAQRRNPLLVATFVLLVVAGFESSAWVGGVTFALIAAAAGLLILNVAAPSERLPFLMSSTGAAVLALALAAPLLRDQYMMTAASGGALPVVLRPYEVLGEFFPSTLRHVLDLPAYWLILLPVELASIYPAGLIAMAGMLATHTLDPKRKLLAQTFAAMTIASLIVAWLAVSTMGNNNDLGWRAVLPAVMALIVFAAAGLSVWLSSRRRLASAAAVAALLLGLYQGVQIGYDDVTGRVASFSNVFAKTPAMWEAVRKHAAPDDRVANNPLFLQDATPWPVNLSWALLSNRRSCFAGRELTLAYVPVPRVRQQEINAQFIRVFSGEGSADDVRDLATRYGCRVVLVTAQDGAWVSDPFAVSSYYRLAETKPDEWKIYIAPAVGLAQSGETRTQGSKFR